MEIKNLETPEQITEIKNAKGLRVIFKHNTTCAISNSVWPEFKQEADQIPGLARVYYLDLMANRDISDAVAEQFKVPHESPQMLLIKDGECIYNESLYDISAEKTAEAVA
jgi:bacillithiol system protein YtxJ